MRVQFVTAYTVALALATAAAALPYGSNATRTGSDYDISLIVGGKQRRAHLHLPPETSGSPGLPLVFNWHAMMETMTQQQGLSDLDRVADQHGFAVVYPQGFAPATVLGYKLGGYTHNGGGCCSSADADEVDNVGFTFNQVISDVIPDWLRRPLCLFSPFVCHRPACPLTSLAHH